MTFQEWLESPEVRMIHLYFEDNLAIRISRQVRRPDHFDLYLGTCSSDHKKFRPILHGYGLQGRKELITALFALPMEASRKETTQKKIIEILDDLSNDIQIKYE